MSSRTVKLGSVSGIPEFRVHHWKPEKRNTKIKAYLKIKTSCSDRVWDEIVKCALSAVGVVGIAAILSGGSSAFLAVLLPCWAGKGIQLTADNVRVYTKFSRGSWRRLI
jgi:hypothetical protein